MRSSQAVRRLGAAVAGMVILAAVHITVAGSAVDPKAPLDRPNPADNARARSAVTRLSDLVAGFRVDAKKERAPLIPHCNGYPGDRSDITVTGSARSSFRQGANNSIGSAVLYFKTYADAERYWKATVRSKYLECLALFAKRMWAEPAETKTLMARQIPIGATSAEKAIAYRTITRVASPDVEPYAWSETVAFVKLGRGVGILRIVYVNQLCECQTGLAVDLTRRLRAAH